MTKRETKNATTNAVISTETFTYDAAGNITGGSADDTFTYDTNYSPDMKRFINADIVAGGISNAVTLNRFAYANGNPVSLVDPFGLSPDSKGSIDFALVYEKIKRIKTKHDTELASEMLATVLDQLLNFKHIWKYGAEFSLTSLIGPSTTVSCSTTFSQTSETQDSWGSAEFSAVIDDQMELVEEVTFSQIKRDRETTRSASFNDVLSSVGNVVGGGALLCTCLVGAVLVGVLCGGGLLPA